MSAIQTGTSTLPPVPLTIEGASVLHQMMRVRWCAWNALPRAKHHDLLAEAIDVLSEMERKKTAVFSLIGHKGDLMLVHFRDSVEELNDAELALSRTRLCDYLEPTSSYLSVVELGLYDSTMKTYQ